MNKNRYSVSFWGDFVSQAPSSIIIDNNIKKLLDSSDYNIINFEAPVRREDDRKTPKSGPSLCQSAKAPAFLESLGFNVVSLANNHIFDYGESSCKYTQSLFKKADTIGVGLFTEAYKPSILRIEDQHVAIFAAAHKEFGCIDSPECNYGYAWACHPFLLHQVSQYKKKGYIVIIFAHCGIEDIPIPIPEWRYKYREFVEAGADAVIASHPHIIQGYEDYKGRRIYYSLGNAFFDRENVEEHWNNGMVVSLIINNDGSIDYNETYTQKDGNMYKSIPKPKVTIDELNKKLNEEDYFDNVDSYVSKLMPMYLAYYMRGCNGVDKILGLKSILRSIKRMIYPRYEYILLLNMIQCESHRWLFERGLKRILE